MSNRIIGCVFFIIMIIAVIIVPFAPGIYQKYNKPQPGIIIEVVTVTPTI